MGLAKEVQADDQVVHVHAVCQLLKIDTDASRARRIPPIFVCRLSAAPALRCLFSLRPPPPAHYAQPRRPIRLARRPHSRSIRRRTPAAFPPQHERSSSSRCSQVRPTHDSSSRSSGGAERSAPSASLLRARADCILLLCPFCPLSSRHWAVQYTYVPDVMSKRAPLRPAHLQLASEYKAAGKMLQGGAFTEPPMGALLTFCQLTDTGAARGVRMEM